MRILSFVAAAVFATTLTAAPLELDRAATAMSGMEAGFTHRFTAKGFKTAQVESGSVVFGALPMMRWSYARPEEKLFVFDGTSSWFYVPADKQVTVGRLTEARRRELPFLVLGDAAARDRAFAVREQSRGGSVVTTLQPRDANALVRSVTVTIAPSTHLISRIEYTDREGNQTSFDFSGYHRRAAPAELFRFDPPAGVQVIRAD
ncbi:MAG: outer membrane lipoprotein chaperone LolA [Acidobacteria bacterium]|nr:outer membrane lipoprotein chaperone LolA [Acidobacteriota bacterium]MBV9474581.1 outer membrane lipoprotein chaperone LolA [Acidobacteriota bacterium]